MTHIHLRTRADWLRAIRYFAVTAFVFFGAGSASATLLSSVQASDGVNPGNVSEPNIGRSVAVAPDGTIYVAYLDGSTVRVARSTDRGASFQPSVAAISGPNVVNINVAVAANGFAYVAGVAIDNSVNLARSTDGGQSFASAPIGTTGNPNEVGVVTDGIYVYVAATSASGPGVDVFSSSDGGVTFPTIATAPVSAAYWHLNVDPVSGNVVVSGDTPSIFVSVSTDHGATFSAPQNPAGVDFFSSTAISSGPLGSYLFVSGAVGSGAVRINLADYSSTPLPNLPLTNGDLQAASLAGDSNGNVVAGYINGSGDAAFVVSNDLGANFGPETSVSGTAKETVEINSAYGDVLFAYLLGGQVHVDVHCGLLGAWCLTVSDGNAYARYGHTTNYLVTITNPTATAALGEQVSGAFSAALDSAAASWSCIAGPKSSCGQTAGSGGFASAFDIGAGDTVSWVVSVPVLANAAEDTAVFDVSGSGAFAHDVDTLVLFRDGFDVPNGNGTNMPGSVAGN